MNEKTKQFLTNNWKTLAAGAAVLLTLAFVSAEKPLQPAPDGEQFVLGHPATNAKEEYEECYVAMRDNEIALVEASPDERKTWEQKWESRGKSVTTGSDADLACAEVAASLGQVHDRYHDAEEVGLMRDMSAGGLAGIGAQIALDSSSAPQTSSAHRLTREQRVAARTLGKDRHLLISAILEDSPAFRAGLKPGDLVIRINGESLDGKDANFVANKMIRGEPGSKVHLTVLRKQDGSQVETEITAVRQRIVMHPVTAGKFDNEIYYLRLKDFETQGDNGENRAIAEFQKGLQPVAASAEAGKHPALILDLRGNPGGLLPYAEYILEMLMREGNLITMETRSGDHIYIEKKVLHEPFSETISWHSDEKANEASIEISTEKRFPLVLKESVPIVVLIDENSASASEIVAGTLQSQRPLTRIVGETSFGKSVGQRQITLSHERAMSVTMFHFKPAGRSHAGIGIIPDTIVAKLPTAENVQADQSTPSADNQLDAALKEAQSLLDKAMQQEQLADQAKMRNSQRETRIKKQIAESLTP